MTQIIDMEKCAYCDDEYVVVDEMFCERCKPRVEIDIAIVTLDTEASKLKHVPPDRMCFYKKHLIGIIKQLEQIVEKL